MAHPAGFPLLAAIKVHVYRRLDLEVVPVPQPSNPDHVEVVLERFVKSQRQSKARQLKKAAVVVAVEGSAEEVFERLVDRCAEYDRGGGLNA